MKHMLLLLFLCVAAYAAWVLSDKGARKTAIREITRHGIRIGFIVLVLVLLLLAATQLPSSPLI